MSGLSHEDHITLAAGFLGQSIRPDATYLANVISPAVERIVERHVRAALESARDALYRGDGPDVYVDADLIYGEWLGNRAHSLSPDG